MSLTPLSAPPQPGSACHLRIPRELHQIEAQIAQHVTDLHPAHTLILAPWVYGAVQTKSTCLKAILIEGAFLPHNTPR